MAKKDKIVTWYDGAKYNETQGLVWELTCNKCGGKMVRDENFDEEEVVFVCEGCGEFVYYTDYTDGTYENGEPEYDVIFGDGIDMSEACKACGNPAYPNCVEGCPVHDD